MLFGKQPSPVEFINDLDGEVARFFAVLRDQGEALTRACRMTPFSRAEFESYTERPAIWLLISGAVRQFR